MAQSISGTVKLYLPNLHGDLSLIANTSQGITGTQAFKPYGEKGVLTGDTSYFGFQSDPTDSDTALVDMGARLYDPLQGRVDTRDSLFGSLQAPTSLNQYVYGGDNPVSLWDPDGMCYRDPDNQTGCGYTMDSGGKSKRYDPTYGTGCWKDCAPREYSGTHGHEVVIPPPPPKPPKPVVMLNATSAANLSAWSARMNSMAPINDYQTATQDEFDAAKPHCNAWCEAKRAAGATWQGVRFGLTAPETAIGVGWAEATALAGNMRHGHVGGAGCGFQSGLVVCKNTPKWASIGGPAFTYGSAVLIDKGETANLGHEARHADQCAILCPVLGPVGWPLTYVGVGMGGSLVTGGGLFCHNVFEMWAGLKSGGYNNC